VDELDELGELGVEDELVAEDAAGLSAGFGVDAGGV
jgi:hypothetical protein